MTDKAKDFLQIKSIIDLAKLLDCKVSTLMYYCTPRQSSSCYHSFNIEKKTGGYRQILAPNTQLKYLQRKLSEILYEFYEPKKIATGFIKGKSVVTNAKPHVNKRFILNIDIKDFFGSIHFGRVLGLFLNYPFSFDYDVAVLLTQLVCFRAKLPQGAPTSPIITNFICRNLDNDLIQLASKYKIICTRYCDDITFSTKAKCFPIEIAYKKEREVVLGKELVDVFIKNDFIINDSKKRLQSGYSRQIITGIVVNKKVNIQNKKYREFRTILHNAYCNGLPKAAIDNNFFKEINGTKVPDVNGFERYIVGTINYYKMVMTFNSSKYQYLARKYNDLCGCEIFEIPESFNSKINKNIFIIEDIRENNQGTAFLVRDIGLVTCLHNVASICKEPSKTELEKYVKENIKVYLPSNEKKQYTVELKCFYFTEDLLILNIMGVDTDDGFEIERDELKTNESSYISVSYPNYSSGNTVDIMDNIKIRGKINPFKQEMYVVDKAFITGSSGGPVFNQNHKVIGYIDRGNECTGNPNGLSAFCSISFLLKK